MTSIKLPSSPQVIKTQQNEKETVYHSLKVKKSITSITELQDESLNMIKKKTNKIQLSIFNDKLVDQNCKYEEATKEMTELNTQKCEESQINACCIDKRCCYCRQTSNLIQICQCSFAHQGCANQKLKAGPLEKQIYCAQCKDIRHLNGIVSFDFSRWRQFKWCLLIESTLLLLVICLVTVFTFYSLKIEQDKKYTISCLVCSYTIGFVVVVCLISRIITHFKCIRFEIKSYHPKNRDYNKQYINLLLTE